jgi:hypothetical protein
MKSKPRDQNFAAITSVFCFGLSYGLLVSLAPVALINHRHLSQFLFEQGWSKFCFYLLSALVGGLTAVMVFNAECEHSGAKDSAKQLTARQRLVAFLKAHVFEMVATVVVFLFTACACLCQKLGIADLGEATSNLGLVLIVAAMSCQFIEVQPAGIKERQSCPSKVPGWRWTLSEPVSFAWVILLLGISLLFSTWFPLLALPGIVIGMKWRLTSKLEEQAALSKRACEAHEASS